MQVKEVIQKTTYFFKEKGIDTPRLDAELLIAHALKWERLQLYLKFDYPMTEAELEASRALVRRRGQGEPVAYILGTRDFYESSFAVETGVLIPRPESESLVQAALDLANGRTEFAAIDFGCGSGAIGLSIAKALPDARVLLIDASETAVRVTTANAHALGVMDRVSIICSEIETLTRDGVATALDGRAIGAILANPPYVGREDTRLAWDVRKYEPHEALFSDENGLAHARQWIAKAFEITDSGALVAFEIGCDQGAAVRELFIESGFADVAVKKDLAGHDRFVQGFKSATIHS